VFPRPGTNLFDVADDLVVCAPGSINRINADKGDRIAASCRGKQSTMR
jgi:hypothetical protein